MYQKDTSKNSEPPCKRWTFQHLQGVPVGGEGEILSTGSARLCTSKTQSQQHCERRRRAAAPCFVTKSRSLHLPQAAVALFAHAPPRRSVQISPYFSAVTEKAKRHSIRVPFLWRRRRDLKRRPSTVSTSFIDCLLHIYYLFILLVFTPQKLDSVHYRLGNGDAHKTRILG